MADRGTGERRGFGRGRGDRGRGGRGGRGQRRGDKKDDKEQWVPVTKLGRLVQAGKIKTIEEIFLFSLQIKEYQVVDILIPKLQDEVMKVKPVQKQTTAGQRTRFKAYVAVGDGDGHLGLGVKSSKEIAHAIRGGIVSAKMNIVPIRRGYWGFNEGKPHTVPCKVTGKCGSVRIRLIPAPRGSGVVASLVPKKLMNMAGIEDVYTSSTGHTRTRGNLALAVYAALAKTYSFLSPDLWTENKFTMGPYQEFTDELASKKL